MEKLLKTHQGSSASCWFNKVFSSLDNPRKVRAIMVNAIDAGFYFLNLDISKPSNIEESYDSKNIMNCVHKPNLFYHVGRYGVNNLSPENKKEWIKLKEKNIRTKIYFKLWRNEPLSKEDPPDLVCEFNIVP